MKLEILYKKKGLLGIGEKKSYNNIRRNNYKPITPCHPRGSHNEIPTPFSKH
jgi:hypothetical protein